MFIFHFISFANVAINEFISGATFMGYLAAGLFFMRFWKETRDRLFAIFAVAFWILSINRFGFLYFNEADEARTLLYIVRLIAFVLILIAILDKNRTSKT